MILGMARSSTAATGNSAHEAVNSSCSDLLTHMSRSDPRLALYFQIPAADRANAIVAILESPAGARFRQEASRAIVQALSVERLVPDIYAEWRPLVRDAMLYFGANFSTPRLAPKLVEQIELPSDTPPEKRLSRLIARVPGLQKLGQVIARNRHLHRGLRRELTQLENGISDVTADEMRAIVVRNLGPALKHYAVKIVPGIFREASVSAVLRFTWFNPEQRRRQRGVFKVMKAYIVDYFAEDMDLLAQLAKHLGSKHKKYGFAEHTLPETFDDVRRLLQHEVEFRREQANLRKATHAYGSFASVRIPEMIPQLCTPIITAMSEEHGQKITSAASRLSKARRTRLAEQLIDIVIAVPLLTPGGSGMFHADPHAGNLLYNQRSGTLTLLDWALTGHVTQEQRRQFAMLFLMVLLRDPQELCSVIEAISFRKRLGSSRQRRTIREEVTRFFDAEPFTRIPRAVDVVDLLERIAWRGVRLPNHLVLLRKVLFTLDGILHDVAGSSTSMEFLMMRRLLESWLKNPTQIGWPLPLRDWIRVSLSATLYGSRVAVRGLEQLAA